jgi:hypothetical protein
MKNDMKKDMKKSTKAPKKPRFEARNSADAAREVMKVKAKKKY